ncbi:hypothetical protein M569_14621, partial [Genlisea aurea]
QSIPAYTMSYFLLPKTFTQELKSILARFWWNNREASKLHWISWDKLTRSKKDGGLGFRDLHIQNQALLAKQSWNLLKRPTSLICRLLKAKYFPNSSFLSAELSRAPSQIWRSIHATRQTLCQGLRWRVGSGTQIHIWEDPWLPCGPSFKPLFRNPLHSEAFLVADLFILGQRRWNQPLIRRMFHPIDANLILQLPLAHHHADDLLIWNYTKNGRYSTASGYHLLRNAQDMWNSRESTSSTGSTKFWTTLWNFSAPPKVLFFIWRLCSNIIPLKTELQRRHISASDDCAMCGLRPETWRHLFVECEFA